MNILNINPRILDEEDWRVINDNIRLEAHAHAIVHACFEQVLTLLRGLFLSPKICKITLHKRGVIGIVFFRLSSGFQTSRGI
jgi:hypothetical protein